jgi:hypothetical protein
MKPPATDPPDVTDAFQARRDADEPRAGWSTALDQLKQLLEGA